MTISRKPSLRHFPLTLALLGGPLTLASPARADEAACVAASENEFALRKAGKLLDALKELAVCAAPKCSAEVKAECAKRLIEVRAAQPAVILGATDEAGNDMGAVNVTLDGAPLTGSLDGGATTVDPGSHTLRFEAPGKPPVEKKVIFREGEKDRHITVVLGAPTAVLPPAAAPSSGTWWNARKTLAVTSGAVGLVGVVLGSAFGVAAKSDWSSSQSLCSPGNCPSTSAHDSAVSDQQSASTCALVSTIGFVVGVAGIAGGAALWFTAPSGASGSGAGGGTRARVRIAPMIGAGTGGLVMRGGF
jgi:hypothetical protein